MKKSFLRIFVYLLSMYFISINLIGCNINLFNKKSSEETNESLPQNRLSSKTLTFLFSGTEPKGQSKVIDQIEKSLRDTLNLKLNFKWVAPRSYESTINTLLEASQPVDAFQLYKDENIDTIDMFMQKDKILDLTTLLKTKAPKLYNTYSEGEIANVTYDGKIMALSYHLPRSKRICAVVREDMAKSNNIQDIKDYADLDKVLKIIKNNSNSKFPMAFTKNTLELFAEANGYISVGNFLVYKQNDPEMKIIPWEGTEVFGIAINTIQNWTANKYIENNQGGWLPGMGDLDIVDKGFADCVLTDWETAQEYIQMHNGNATKLKIFPLYMDKLSARPSDFVAMVLNKNTKEPERVLRFLEWIQASQENYDLFMYGIKNENYILKGDNVEYPEGKTKYFGWEGSLAFLNLDYTHSVGNDTGFKEVYKKVADAGTKAAPSAGFKPNLTAVKDLTNRRKDLYEEFSIKFRTNGYTNSSYDIDSFIKANSTAGANALVAEMQKQLYEWKAKNKK